MTKPRRTKRATQAVKVSSFNIARHLSSALGAVPSMIWGGFYLLLIPLFAGFYTLLPEASFYHSTIVHDARYKEDQKLLENEIEAWANAKFTPRLSEAIEQVESKKQKTIDYYAGYDPTQLWPEVLASAKFDNGEKLSMEFYLGGMIHAVVTKDMDYTPPKITYEQSEGFDLMAKCKKEEESICKAKLVEQALKPDKYFIAPTEINELFNKLRTEGSGMNYGTDLHTFGRMLYLSAVTVTTVGYGDIVPLTDIARFAVSFEAIAGIVLIGLFLNALAHEIQSRNNL